MTKPQTHEGYSKSLTDGCEQMLVTLLRGLGPWKESVALIGGLTPRYLVRAKPPDIPEHSGTQDVDVVLELTVLADVDAYHTLEGNLQRLGFERGTNERNQRVNWRWEVRVDKATLRLEFLADMPGMKRVEALPTEGNVSALNVPHASMVFDHFKEIEITAESLGGNGVITEKVKHADLVSFTTLKAFAFAQRWERKDAHDLIYCLEHCEPKDEILPLFAKALDGKHREALIEAFALLRRHFATDAGVEGYLKDGPVAVAKFELGERDEDGEARVLRQREASYVIEQLLSQMGL